MIRAFENSDTERVMELWLRGNQEAHSFIPEEYWHSNFPMVKEALRQAELTVFEEEGTIRGFLGMTGGYIAGIFVDRTHRSLKIGKKLLDHAKLTHRELSLNVYKKNRRAVSFYFREDFCIDAEGTDEATGEAEYTMIWKSPSDKIG